MMDLYVGDVLPTMGWYNIGGMTTIGVLISVGLIVIALVATIVLVATKACKSCRGVSEASEEDAAEGSNAETNNEIANLVEPGYLEEGDDGTAEKVFEQKPRRTRTGRR